MTGITRAAALCICLLTLAWAPPGSVRAESIAQGQSGSCSKWRVVPTPNPRIGVQLHSISGTSSRDVWAVGGYGISPAPPFLMHWDGWGWTQSELQAIYARYPADVVAISPTDAWVVGELVLPSAIRPLLMHWDGVAWRTMPAPVKSDYAYLNAVDALSSDDVWAVGLVDDAEGLRPLTLHWDGSVWRRVPAPAATSLANELYEVSAAAPDDVWAVGHQQQPPIQFEPLIEHWDGTRWSVVPTEPVSGDDAHLYGVAAISATDAWAVGGASGPAGLAAMIQHWDGSSWRVVPAAPSARPTVLYDVSAASSTDVWAVGRVGSLTLQDPLAQHWDGTSWETVPAPSPGGSNAEFDAVDVISPVDVWGAGFAFNEPGYLLVEHSRGCQGLAPLLP